MELSPGTRRLLEKILKANNVPFFLHEKFLSEGAKMAEPYAKKNGHHFIKDEDAIEAVKALTPPEKKAEAKEAMRKSGIDVEQYFPDW